MKLNLLRINNSSYYILITILVFTIYGNSINNEYSLDDDLVAYNNKVVENGISSIKSIFTKRTQKANKNTIYRPLPLLTFALEKQFLSHYPASQSKNEKKRKDVLTQANISHFVNLILYVLTCVLLFNVLRVIFLDYNALLPILVVILFLVHPLHTEPVNNLKSRDELLMLLFVLLSIQQFLKYCFSGKYYHIFLGFSFFVIAQFSKQNAIAVLGVLPVLLYYLKVSYKKIFFLSGISVLGVLSFSLFKFNVIESLGRDHFHYENPLFFEGGFLERIALGFYCSCFYLKMLIFPEHLSFYYGYNQIPMVSFKDWEVWLSAIIFIPVGVYGFYLFLKRKVLGLGIVLWFGIMLGVVNFVFPIVGIVADRFAYMFSIGYCIVLGWGILKLFKVSVDKEVKSVNLPISFVLITSLIVVIYSGRVIIRNNNWHDHLTLYNHDIKHLENSAKAHAILSSTLYPLVMEKIKVNPNDQSINKDIDQLIFHYQEAVRIDSTYLTCLNNLGSAYSILKRDYHQAIYYSRKAIAINPGYLEAHFNLAFSYDALHEYESALFHYIEVLRINPNYGNAYIKLGLLLNRNNKLKDGVVLLNQLAENNPQPKDMYLNIANLISRQGPENIDFALIYFVKSFEEDTEDEVICKHLVMLYEMKGDQKAINYYTAFLN